MPPPHGLDSDRIKIVFITFVRKGKAKGEKERERRKGLDAFQGVLYSLSRRIKDFMHVTYECALHRCNYGVEKTRPV